MNVWIIIATSMEWDNAVLIGIYPSEEKANKAEQDYIAEQSKDITVSIWEDELELP